ncbi:MAG: hypothetical protein FGM41_07565, partial [Bacteroidetes bacterium]|nr:hypothetical protein [Bacteroidota bacterium]
MRITYSIVFLLVSFLGKAQFSPSSFTAQSNIAVGSGTSQPAGLNSADLDGDGKIDFVSTNHGNATISMLRNTSTPGNISFAPKVDSSGFPAITNALLGDLNKDGKPEIVVCHFSTNALKIFLNQSTPGNLLMSGSITVPSVIATPGGGVVADFNHDGFSDLCILNFNSLGMTIFRNTTTIVGASPTFAAPNFIVTTTSATTPNPRYAVAAHLDNDTLIDLVVVNYANQPLAVFKNTSTGGSISFASPIYLASVNLATGADVKDLDGDGKAEIVVGNINNNNSIRVYRNTSSGSALSFATPFLLPFSFLYELRLSDFDGDGRTDIVATSQNNNYAAVIRNVYTSGTLSSSSFSGIPTYSLGTSPANINAHDYDLDGKVDFIATNYASHNVSIRRNVHFFPSPTLKASNLSVSSTGPNTWQLNWTKGNGTRRIIVAQANRFNNNYPINGRTYTANATFGNGDTIGSNAFVIYNDTGNSCTLTGLLPGSAYHFSLFEYNGNTIYTGYQTSPFDSVKTGIIGNTFYAKTNGRLDSLGTWGTNPNGTGTPPNSFNEPNSYYIVTNNTSPTILSNWFVTGANTAIIVSGGYNLNIPTGLVFGADSIAVLANGTLTLNGNLFANKAYFDTLSNAQFTANTPQNIPGFNYFNLISVGSVKTLSNPVTVRNNLTSLTNINGNSHTLTIGSGPNQRGVMNMANTVFNGKLTRWFGPNPLTTDLSFPIAINNVSYNATLNFSGNVSSAGTITIEFIPGNPGNGGLPLFDFSTTPVIQINRTAANGIWRIETGNGFNIGSTVYTLSLTGTGFFGVSNFGELRMVRRPLSGSWQLAGSAAANSGSNATPIVVRSGMNIWGDFAIAGDLNTNPLPVTLLSFKGKSTAYGDALSWVTASEQNSERFDIEQRMDNQWLVIGSVKSAVNSSTNQSYSFLAKEQFGENFYRLKMIDIDQSFTYS